MQCRAAHDLTYNKPCATSEDSDQPVHPPSIARVLVYPSLDSPEAVKDTSAKTPIRLRNMILILHCCCFAANLIVKTNYLSKYQFFGCTCDFQTLKVIYMIFLGPV